MAFMYRSMECAFMTESSIFSVMTGWIADNLFKLFFAY